MLMKNKEILIVFALTLTTTILGCQFFADIKVLNKSTDLPVFSLEKPSGISPIGEVRPLVYSYGVYAMNEGLVNHSKEMWRALSISTDGMHVADIKYGVVIKGFKEVVRAKRLVENVPYYFYITGPTCGGYAFKLVEEKGRIVVHEVKSRERCPTLNY